MQQAFNDCEIFGAMALRRIFRNQNHFSTGAPNFRPVRRFFGISGSTTAIEPATVAAHVRSDGWRLGPPRVRKGRQYPSDEHRLCLEKTGDREEKQSGKHGQQNGYGGPRRKTWDRRGVRRIDHCERKSLVRDHHSVEFFLAREDLDQGIALLGLCDMGKLTLDIGHTRQDVPLALLADNVVGPAQYSVQQVLRIFGTAAFHRRDP